MANIRSTEDIINRLDNRENMLSEAANEEALDVMNEEELDEFAQLEEDEDDESRAITKANILDTIKAYKTYKNEDKELIELCNVVEKLVDTVRKDGVSTMKERELFGKVQDRLDEFIIKVEKDIVEVDNEANQKLKTIKQGELVWFSDEDFQNNTALYKIEKDLNKKKADALEKKNLATMFRIYLNRQSEGGLVIDENDDKTKFVDGTGKKLYLMGKAVPFDVISDASLQDALVKDEYPLFPGEPHVNDIVQRNLYDRYCVSVLSILSEDYPGEIINCMKDNLDGTVTVRLYGRDDDIEYFPVYVKVDKVINTQAGVIISGKDGCIWASCLERALAISGLYDCVNENLPHMLPVPEDIESKYEELKRLEAAGNLTEEIILSEKENYPWLFVPIIEQGKSALKPWPSVDCILTGYAGPIAEMILGPNFKSCNIQMPSLIKEERDALHAGKRLTRHYSSDELKFYNFIKQFSGKKYNILAGSRFDSTIIMDAHTYSVLGVKETSLEEKYLMLKNPWGTLVEGENMYCGLETIFGLDGTRTRKWTYVSNGIFGIELLDFLNEFDFIDINGINKYDMQVVCGKSRAYKMDEIFDDLSQRLKNAREQEINQTLIIKSIDGTINPCGIQKEVKELFVDEDGTKKVRYINAEGEEVVEDYKDLFVKIAGFLLRDGREEVIKGKLKPGEEESLMSFLSMIDIPEAEMPVDPDFSLKEEKLEFRTVMSYLKPISDLSVILDSTKRYNDNEANEYVNLRNKLNRVKTNLLLLNEQPFVELKNEICGLEPYLDAYDKFNKRSPAKIWRRTIRLEVCSMLRNVIAEANNYSKKPNKSIYEEYAKIYAVEMAAQKGLKLEGDNVLIIAKRILETPQYYEKIQKKNIFYLKHGRDKDFMEKLKAFM